MSSSYTKGKRIALDYVIKSDIQIEKVKQIVSEIIRECGNDVSLSTHLIQTDSSDWKSVIKKDSFFESVQVINKENEFIKLIKQDRVLKGIDVAKYILSKKKCTHLKLEKLVYMCFADYLCEFGKPLFLDEIFAYKYGPVVKSVYDVYKKYGYESIEKEKDINVTSILEMPSKSRILFAEDGLTKVKSIEKTLNIYGELSASKLVDITHKESTPWTMTGKGMLFNKIISEDIILKYHVNESV